MTDIIVKIIEDDPSQYPEGISSQEQILKDCGMSLPEIKDYIAANMPPPPTPPEEVERRRQKAEAERERLEKLKVSDPEAYERETNPKAVNKGLEGLKSDSRRGSMGGSRRGSLIPGRSRQGSIALGGPDRASVAMVTDDPEHKKNLKAALAGAFNDATIRDILGDLPPNASEDDIKAALAAAGLTGDAATQMMAIVRGGGMSAETRKLMEQIMANAEGTDEVNSRVAALLAGSSLTTTKGASKVNGREIDMVQYDGANMEEMKEKKDTFEMPEIPHVAIPQLREGALTNGVTMRDHSGGSGTIKRGSIKRQSEIMREKKMSRQEEREEERKRKESYFRKVTGLRKAKVPLMVYSCGGFSRCFGIARFYDLEGPPVGIEYSKAGEDEARGGL